MLVKSSEVLLPGKGNSNYDCIVLSKILSIIYSIHYPSCTCSLNAMRVQRNYKMFSVARERFIKHLDELVPEGDMGLRAVVGVIGEVVEEGSL